MGLRVLVERLDDGHPCVGRELAGHVPPGREARALGVVLATLVLPGEHTARQREVRHERHREALDRRQHLGLHLAVEEAVVVLHVHEARDAEVTCRPRRFVELRGREVGATDLAHLAGSDELAERLERLADRRLRIGLVQQVEVDAVGAEALQARIAAGEHVLTAAAA